MPASQDVFKRVMRRWTTGVTIVTTRRGDAIHGLTVSGFTGVSLDPPLVLVSVGHNQYSHTWLQESDCFAVNFLHADQVDLSDRFAGRAPQVADRFEGVAYRTQVTGAPILEDCLAWFDCHIVAMHTAGDHTLFIGEVVAGDVVLEAEPLTYYNGAYRRLSIQAAKVQSAS